MPMCILPGKAIPKMTYTVSGGMLKPYSFTHCWHCSSYCCVRGDIQALTCSAIWWLSARDSYPQHSYSCKYYFLLLLYF